MWRRQRWDEECEEDKDEIMNGKKTKMRRRKQERVKQKEEEKERNIGGK